MQLPETRLRRSGTLEFTSLLFKRKPQKAVVLSLEPADVTSKATLNNCESDSTYFTWHLICI